MGFACKKFGSIKKCQNFPKLGVFVRGTPYKIWFFRIFRVFLGNLGQIWGKWPKFGILGDLERDVGNGRTFEN